MKAIDLTDRQFGRLTIIRPVWQDTNTRKNIKKWECQCECGNILRTFTNALVSGKIRSCGCLRYKGGKLNNYGYKSIYSRELRKYVQEHRVLYEQHYGIKLQPHQTVHHKNGIRDDNRVENLELWDSRHPKGQLVSDKLTHYFDIVKEYLSHPEYEHVIREQLNTLSDTTK